MGCDPDDMNEKLPRVIVGTLLEMFE